MISNEEIKEAILIAGPLIKKMGITKENFILIYKYLDNMKEKYKINSNKASMMLRQVLNNKQVNNIID